MLLLRCRSALLHRVSLLQQKRLLVTQHHQQQGHQQHRSYHEVSFGAVGEPLDVLEYHRLARYATDDADDPPNHDDGRSDDLKTDTNTTWVRVDMKHAPWNPADANTVQGKYPSPYSTTTTMSEQQAALLNSLRRSRFLPHHAVAGSEGWGRVTEVVVPHHHHGVDENMDSSIIANSVPQAGDWVTMGHPSLGTFRSSLWLPADAVLTVERGAELVGTLGPRAATLFQLGGTAARLLKFVDLKPGDVVVQNAGNSGVGLMVSQLVAALYPDVAVVSIVRRADKTVEQMEELTDYLTQAGNNSLIAAEEDLLQDRSAVADFKARICESTGSDRPPRLALNAVGGESSNLLLQLLGPTGTHVTYGGMSQKPVTVATPQLLFKDLRLRGYWHSAWMIQTSHAERKALVNGLADLVLEGTLDCPPAQVFSLADVLHGIKSGNTQSDQVIRSKIVFDCQEPE
jgi:NADPH:quinone reductase-like Zn-dependent oxidoreductase